jgi:hypothetical protein
MPTGVDFSQDVKQIMFNVIQFVEREKGGCLIPLNNVNDRIKSMLGISMTSVERLKREIREQEREMLEEENELIALQKRRDQENKIKNMLRFKRHFGFDIHVQDHHQFLLRRILLQEYSCLFLNHHKKVVTLVLRLSF